MTPNLLLDGARFAESPDIDDPRLADYISSCRTNPR
jgi:hypothetical protein